MNFLYDLLEFLTGFELNLQIDLGGELVSLSCPILEQGYFSIYLGLVSLHKGFVHSLLD